MTTRLGRNRMTLPKYRRRRGGYLYVYVMEVSLIVSVIGLSAIMAARIQLRRSHGNNDWHEARQLASAALENAITTLNQDPQWRVNYVCDVEYPAQGTSLGSGNYTWMLLDDDGDLNDDETDTVEIVGTGRMGATVYRESVTCSPSGGPLTCLQSALHSSVGLDFQFGQFSSNYWASSNGNCDASNGVTVQTHIEAAGTINGGTYLGIVDEGADLRTMPDKDHVLDYYLANGTQINIDDLPAAGENRFLEACLLSPSVNPFGSNKTNPEGIYWIDCQGKQLIIQNCRIVGTLVLRQPGPLSVVAAAVNWEPALEHYPALLAGGGISIVSTQDPLAEGDWSVNFNPADTPYPYLAGSGSNADADLSDSYPSKITGLVYVSGDLQIPDGSPSFDGVVIAAGEFIMTTPGSVTCRYRDTFRHYPPPGFTTGNELTVINGTWRRALGN